MGFSEKQRQIMRFPYTGKKGIICNGAVRSGKTSIMSLSFFLWAMGNFDNCAFAICGKSVGVVERNVITPLLGIRYLANNFSITYNRSGREIIARRGKRTNRFYLFGGKDESSYSLIQGVTLAGVFLDEVALMPESFVSQAMARCSVKGSKFWFSCNPEGPQHWFKTDFIDRAEERNFEVIWFLMEDNPSLDAETLEDYKKQYQGVFYDRYILGKWAQASGIIYDSFNEQKHVYQDRMSSLPQRCREGDARPLYGADFGTQNPQVYLKAYKTRMPDGLMHLFVDDELYYSGRKTQAQKEPRQYVDMFHTFNGQERYQFIIIDPSATPLIAAHRNAGDKVIQAKNDVYDGISKVHSMFQQDRIHINARCKNLIGELGMYAWDEKKTDKGKEEPVKEFDHCCDALRYIINTAFADYEIYRQ